MTETPHTPPPDALPATGHATLGDVALVFLKLGCTAFGGPAAHIAMMRQEMVRRRSWVTDQEFLDLVGAANLIPGPSSTELAMFLGYVRAGWRGLLAAGCLFILPAMLLVTAFAWAYQHYGATPQAGWLLYGVKPVIIAIIVHALWGLARTASARRPLILISIGVAVLFLRGAPALPLLLGGGLLVLVASQAATRRAALPMAVIGPVAALPGAIAVGGTAVSLTQLGLTFLKIGAVMYGSGYVLLAFLHADFVDRLGWLNDQQLLDAIAVGQFTPGPVFTTATFIGYILAGVPGALIATVAIFLPSFVFVALVYPLVPRLRRSQLTRDLLDGVNAGALGLMAAVTWQLGTAALVDVLTVGVAVIAGMTLFRVAINSAWLVLAGAAVGVVAHLWR